MSEEAAAARAWWLGTVQELQHGRRQTERLSLPKDNFRNPLHLKISTSEMLQDIQKMA